MHCFLYTRKTTNVFGSFSVFFLLSFWGQKYEDELEYGL